MAGEINYLGSDEYLEGIDDGRESLAVEILMDLDEYPNNVERIDHIRARCRAVLGMEEPKED